MIGAQLEKGQTRAHAQQRPHTDISEATKDRLQAELAEPISQDSTPDDPEDNPDNQPDRHIYDDIKPFVSEQETITDTPLSDQANVEAQAKA